MKTSLLAIFATLTAASLLRGQEPQAISSDELAKATDLLMAANARLGAVPLKLELTPDRAVGFKIGDVGAILIPDKRLRAEKRDKAARKDKGAVQPVGQLWMAKLSPKSGDSVVSNDKLRLVKVASGEKELELAVFSLGIEKAGKKGFQLTFYSQDNSAVVRVPLTAAKAKGAAPVTLSARRSGEDSGTLELNILGRFTAEIPVGKRAE